MERNYVTVTRCIAPYSESIDKDTIRQEKSLMIAKKLTASDLNLHRTELNSEADKCPNKHRVVPYTELVSHESKPICTEYSPSRPTRSYWTTESDRPWYHAHTRWTLSSRRPRPRHAARPTALVCSWKRHYGNLLLWPSVSTHQTPRQIGLAVKHTHFIDLWPWSMTTLVGGVA